MKGIAVGSVPLNHRPAPDQLYPHAMQVLARERSITGLYEHPPYQPAGRAIYRDAPLVEGAANLRREQLDPSEFSSFLRPVELIFLAAMQKMG